MFLELIISLIPQKNAIGAKSSPEDVSVKVTNPAQQTPNPQKTPKAPTVTLPATSTPTVKAGWVGPTDNITKVANAIQIQAGKSLNTFVLVATGLALSKPVTISIAYLSPQPSRGTNEGRKPMIRPLVINSYIAIQRETVRRGKFTLDITLTQPEPAGGVYSFNVPADVMLDPLYDVSISPLVFKLVRGCSNVGANQIDLHWYAPDDATRGEYQTVHFASKEGEQFTIREFSWARSEVSATGNLHKVVVWYAETGIHGGFGSYPGPGRKIILSRQDANVIRRVGGFIGQYSGLSGNA